MAGIKKSYQNRKKGVGILFEDIYILNGARTPFGKFCGTLSRLSPTDLGVIASRAAISKSGLEPSEIDQVVVANIGQASFDAYFLPRHISLYSGVPVEVPALMVQRICASGLETIITASEQIALGKAGAVLSCGTENMSLAPTVSFGNRMGYQFGKTEFKDMLWEALDDTAAGHSMGSTAENLAKQYGISREEADSFAKQSHDRAIAAAGRCFFKEEIVPVNPAILEVDGFRPRKLPLPKNLKDFTTDENVRETSVEALGKLQPVFSKDGVQTAGNSSGVVDGAASVVVVSSDTAKNSSLKPLGRVIGAASCGVEPKYMGIGPVPAIEILLEMTGLSLNEIGLIEINEAFAAQYLACEKELKLDREKVNVNGGAIAVGHPLAATGVRLGLTILREMNSRKARYGIASACIGGGQGTAVLFENSSL